MTGTRSRQYNSVQIEYQKNKRFRVKGEWNHTCVLHNAMYTANGAKTGAQGNFDTLVPALALALVFPTPSWWTVTLPEVDFFG